ncbi:MAG: hypothetical protein IKP09_11115 [Lentisphaeria bacterium]|jgi:hypothetical protein|nr:hypothetical protein [Lentisphaeria bacterium]
MTLRYLILSSLAAALFLSAAACSTQERSGRSRRPFNEPASWETNPYGDAFRN